MKVTRIVFALVTLVACATGCGVLFDFGNYDTGEPGPDSAVPGVDAPLSDGGAAIRITSVTPNPARWRVGENVTIEVSVVRASTFTDAIALTANALPAGVSVVSGSIAAGSDTGGLVLSAELGARAGPVLTGASVIARTPHGITDQRPLDIQLTGAPGTLDQTFGDGGIISLPIAAAGAVLDDDDSLAIIGDLYRDGGPQLGPVVLHVEPDGTLDMGFGDAGYATPVAEAGFAVAITGDDEGYVVIEDLSPALDGHRTLARVDPSGAPVTSYGEGGTIFYNNKSNATIETAGAAGTVVGFTPFTVGLPTFSVDWFAPNGALRAHYSGNGKGLAFGVDDQDRVVIATSGLTMTRFLADAAVDPAFFDPSDAAARFFAPSATAVLAVADGYLVLGSFPPYGIAKLHTDGTLDQTYGVGGFSEQSGERAAPADGGALYITHGVAIAGVTPTGNADPTLSGAPDMSDAPIAIVVLHTGRIAVVGRSTLRRYWP